MQGRKEIRKQSQKESQDAIFYNLTRSICPKCRIVIDAQILVRGKRVFMRKFCQDHGWFESLISSDFDFYRYAENFNKPGTIPFEFQTKVQNGCPLDCGLCPEHKQHTCLGILEITSKCNMECPICFAESGPKNGHHLPLETIYKMIDTLLQSEGPTEIVQVSGGEPTIHPDLLAIIQRLEEVGTKKIMINTNGRRFALNNDFCGEIKEVGKSAIGVYLQFDGLKSETYANLRGNANLLKEKQLAIENLSNNGIGITLVMTVVQGVNDDELGAVTQFMHENQAIGGLAIQPVFAEGRLGKYDPLTHLTASDIIALIEEQTKGMYIRDDWFPIPCPYPHCSACVFSYTDPETGDFTTLKRLVDVEDYLDFFKDRTLPSADTAIKEALESIFSFSTSSSSREMVEDYCVACGIELNMASIEESLGQYMKHVKMITIKPFMSAWDLDIKRLMKCCVHEILPDGRIMPFCAYNTLYRKKFD